MVYVELLENSTFLKKEFCENLCLTSVIRYYYFKYY